MIRGLWLLFIIIVFPIFSEAQEQDQAVLNDHLIPKSDEKTAIDNISDEELKKIAFEILKKQIHKLTPKQRRELFELELEQKEALKRASPPKVLNNIISVDTSPGSKIQKIYLSPDVDTYLNVIDITGKPWPILDVSSGYKEDFPIFSLQQIKPMNKAKLRTVTRVGSTNLTLLLDELDAPITLELIASKSKYHPVATVQVDSRGPNAKAIVNLSMAPVSFSLELENAVIRKKPTPDSVMLETDDNNVLAWLGSNGELFLRTKFNLRHPRPRGIRHGMQGYIAYRTNFLPVITLTDDNGIERLVTLKREVQ